jgi:hypothetical protein
MTTLFVWLGILLTGVVLGCFVKPRTVAITGAVVMVVDIAGLLLSVGLANNTVTEWTWIFGIAGMAIPVIFAVAWMGASISEKVKHTLSKKDDH